MRASDAKGAQVDPTVGGRIERGGRMNGWLALQAEPLHDRSLTKRRTTEQTQGYVRRSLGSPLNDSSTAVNRWSISQGPSDTIWQRGAGLL